MKPTLSDSASAQQRRQSSQDPESGPQPLLLQPMCFSTPHRTKWEDLRSHHSISPYGNIMLDLLEETIFPAVNITARSVCNPDSVSGNHTADCHTDCMGHTHLSTDSQNVTTSSDTDSHETTVDRLCSTTVVEESLEAANTSPVPGSHDSPPTTEGSISTTDPVSRDLDSLLACPTVPDERQDTLVCLISANTKLTEQLLAKVAELEAERDKVIRLKKDIALMKANLSSKDEDINLLEQQLHIYRQEVSIQSPVALTQYPPGF